MCGKQERSSRAPTAILSCICLSSSTQRIRLPGGRALSSSWEAGFAVAEQVLFRLNDRLPPEQHVSSVIVVADLPRLSVNGKVDRKALRQQVPTTGFTGRLHDVARAVR